MAISPSKCKKDSVSETLRIGKKASPTKRFPRYTAITIFSENLSCTAS